MTSDEKERDAMLDQNLRELGQRAEVPADPTPQQRQQWKAAGSAGGGNASGMPRSLRLAAGVALGATVGVVAWIVLSGERPASAAAIFEGFRKALGESVWIDISGVDLGTVQVRGQLYLDVGEPRDAPAHRLGVRGLAVPVRDQVLYSELHVTLLADNARWSDVDAVAVTCQTPRAAWAYTRGNGIGGPATEGPDGRLIPEIPEEFSRDRSWMDFVNKPLGQFGGIPVNMQLGAGAEQVSYEFRAVQREYIASLLSWLLAFSVMERGERIIADLESTATGVRVDTGGPDIVRGCGRVV